MGSIEAAGKIDVLLLTTLANPQAAYDTLIQDFPPARVFVPTLLRITTTGDGGL